MFQAATIITAAARGFLIRRLLRTAHVQALITTLRDAISCATQLHSASDLGDSDIDLMRRLGRQVIMLLYSYVKILNFLLQHFKNVFSF